MKRTRDWRRAQRERIIARTERWMRSHGWFTTPYKRWDDEEARRHVRVNARTPHPCSSHCCGNPRKWFGTKTLQEVRADLL
jgi:hypothetical protein